MLDSGQRWIELEPVYFRGGSSGAEFDGWRLSQYSLLNLIFLITRRIDSSDSGAQYNTRQLAYKTKVEIEFASAGALSRQLAGGDHIPGRSCPRWRRSRSATDWARAARVNLGGLPPVQAAVLWQF